LRASGLRLGVLSDYPPEAKLAALGVGDLFDAVLCAQAPEVGVFKPNPRGILVLLERLGVAPSEALYVGDRAEVDAAAARAAGVACAILSSKAGGAGDGFLSVTSYAELRGVLDRHDAMTNELRGAPTQ
jgi:putative hydrolase of the HAD superfamily